MIVGVHRLADETLRLHEYSPGFDPERFAAHEKFFVEDVRRWARSRFGVALPAERTAVFGVSASGELALAIGLRHPDIYGAVFCASPGAGYRPPDVMPSLASAHVPRCRHAGAVLPRERDPVGGRPARCGCGRRHDRAGRVARRRVLARRVPADGGVGVWTVKHWLHRDGSLPGCPPHLALTPARSPRRWPDGPAFTLSLAWTGVLRGRRSCGDPLPHVPGPGASGLSGHGGVARYDVGGAGQRTPLRQRDQARVYGFQPVQEAGDLLT